MDDKRSDGGWDEELPTNPFGGSSPIDSLALWTAEAAVDEAATARARERWLTRVAAEETTFASVIVDLSERRRAVLVQTRVGRRHRGHISALGLDFVGLRTNTGADILIARAAITAVRTQPNEDRAHSGRVVEVKLRLNEAIAVLAEDRPRVAIATDSNDVLNGDLVSVGRDVLTLRVDGDTRANIYLATHAVVEIALAVG